MKKVINHMLNVLVMFAIYLLVVFVAKKMGLFADISIWALAIGYTIGYYLYQLIKFAVKKMIANKKAKAEI